MQFMLFVISPVILAEGYVLPLASASASTLASSPASVLNWWHRRRLFPHGGPGPGQHRCRFNLGTTSDLGNWRDIKRYFDNLEFFFTAAYLLELGLRLSMQRLVYCRDFIKAVDVVIVVISTMQVFVLSQFSDKGDSLPDFAFARIAKLFRIYRIVKVISS